MTRRIPKNPPPPAPRRVKPKKTPVPMAPERVSQGWLAARLERLRAFPRQPDGWIRLATVTGSEGRTYEIAIRESVLEVQFACTCPDHLHKARLEGRTCKHQRALFHGLKAVMKTDAGKAFLALDARACSAVL